LDSYKSTTSLGQSKELQESACILAGRQGESNMREFLNEPVTVSNLISITVGVVIGKIVVIIRENKRYKKARAEWMADNMRQAGYRD
jgi:hypothetical protein